MLLRVAMSPHNFHRFLCHSSNVVGGGIYLSKIFWCHIRAQSCYWGQQASVNGVKTSITKGGHTDEHHPAVF